MAADKSSHGDGPVAYLVHRPPDDAISGLSYPDTAPARVQRPLLRPLSFPVGDSLHCSSCLQFGSQLNTSRCVHIQELDVGSTSRRKADEAWA